MIEETAITLKVSSLLAETDGDIEEAAELARLRKGVTMDSRDYRTSKIYEAAQYRLHDMRAPETESAV